MQTDFLSFLVVKLFRSVPRLLILTPFCFFSLPSFRDLLPGPCQLSPVSSSLRPEPTSIPPEFPVHPSPVSAPENPSRNYSTPFIQHNPASSNPDSFYFYFFPVPVSRRSSSRLREFLFFAPVFSLFIKSPFGPLFLISCCCLLGSAHGSTPRALSITISALFLFYCSIPVKHSVLEHIC